MTLKNLKSSPIGLVVTFIGDSMTEAEFKEAVKKYSEKGGKIKQLPPDPGWHWAQYTWDKNGKKIKVKVLV